ncbi:perlucin-like [Anopheles darlingi]|uniref:perlucin-like n=1 Tax=Anopheles darlingi TaxID=43151 RepID=UPI0021001E66|nr:perlucin-like [Anopheles darlingi]
MAFPTIKCLLVLVCFQLYLADAGYGSNLESLNEPPRIPSACGPLKPKRYLPQNEKATFLEAWRRCHELGLRLATIANSAESDMIKEVLNGATSKEPYWIGGTDLGLEGVFEWISTGEPIGYKTGYTNFFAGEPNNDKGNENCLDIGNEGVAWFDKPCDAKEKFICETYK